MADANRCVGCPTGSSLAKNCQTFDTELANLNDLLRYAVPQPRRLRIARIKAIVSVMFAATMIMVLAFPRPPLEAKTTGLDDLKTSVTIQATTVGELKAKIAQLEDADKSATDRITSLEKQQAGVYGLGAGFSGLLLILNIWSLWKAKAETQRVIVIGPDSKAHTGIES